MRGHEASRTVSRPTTEKMRGNEPGDILGRSAAADEGSQFGVVLASESSGQRAVVVVVLLASECVRSGGTTVVAVAVCCPKEANKSNGKFRQARCSPGNTGTRGREVRCAAGREWWVGGGSTEGQAGPSRRKVNSDRAHRKTGRRSSRLLQREEREDYVHTVSREPGPVPVRRRMIAVHGKKKKGSERVHT
jgi:hypothetical protein